MLTLKNKRKLKIRINIVVFSVIILGVLAGTQYQAEQQAHSPCIELAAQLGHQNLALWNQDSLGCHGRYNVFAFDELDSIPKGTSKQCLVALLGKPERQYEISDKTVLIYTLSRFCALDTTACDTCLVFLHTSPMPPPSAEVDFDFVNDTLIAVGYTMY